MRCMIIVTSTKVEFEFPYMNYEEESRDVMYRQTKYQAEFHLNRDYLLRSE